MRNCCINIPLAGKKSNVARQAQKAKRLFYPYVKRRTSIYLTKDIDGQINAVFPFTVPDNVEAEKVCQNAANMLNTRIFFKCVYTGRVNYVYPTGYAGKKEKMPLFFTFIDYRI